MTEPDQPVVPARRRLTVDLGEVAIDLIAEGHGPVLVMLPSRGRGSEEFDEGAGRRAGSGFRGLRPQPRGAGRSTGPLEGVRMQDLARDVARVIEREAAGPAVILGHAFGSWIARMVAVAHPRLVAGIVLVAAAAKSFPRELAVAVEQSGAIDLPRDLRLAALRLGFFAQGHDPTPWLDGWFPAAHRVQVTAAAATPQHEYWHAGNAPLLELIPEQDPFKPREKWSETRDDFGARVETVIIPGASHALIPEQPAAVVAVVVPWARAKLAGSPPLA